jgi:hypothetical protein
MARIVASTATKHSDNWTPHDLGKQTLRTSSSDGPSTMSTRVADSMSDSRTPNELSNAEGSSRTGATVDTP